MQLEKNESAKIIRIFKWVIIIVLYSLSNPNRLADFIYLFADSNYPIKKSCNEEKMNENAMLSSYFYHLIYHLM